MVMYIFGQWIKIYRHLTKHMYVFQANMLVVELKSEAVKERHWKQLMRRLRVSWVLSELTLGHLWDLDLLKNETVIRDVLGVAQGEMALEEFLKQVCNNVSGLRF